MRYWRVIKAVFGQVINCGREDFEGCRLESAEFAVSDLPE
jgi:hypothetical protein